MKIAALRNQARAALTGSRRAVTTRPEGSVLVEHPGDHGIRTPQESQCVAAHDLLEHRHGLVELVGLLATVPVS